MLISVITVCYNSEKTIRRTFESMLSQTYQDFEYIIIDGGSSDKTLDIIKEYMPKFNGKMSYVSEKDNGIYDAMNKGIVRCNGKLIGLVNSDDWYENNTLEIVAQNYAGNKYEVVYGMEKTYIDGQESSILFFRHEFLPNQMITHPTCFVTKEIYTDLGMYDSINYKSSADYEFMLRLYVNKEVVFTPVYKIMSNFSLGGVSGSNLGVIETARLKKSLGMITNKKYYITMIKAKLSDLVGNK